MTPFEKLLSRDGVQPHWISSDPIGRTMNGRHKLYSCVDVTPQNPGWTEVIDAAHVAKLEAALKVAVEALKNSHGVVNKINAGKALAEIERIAGGE